MGLITSQGGVKAVERERPNSTFQMSPVSSRGSTGSVECGDGVVGDAIPCNFELIRHRERPPLPEPYSCLDAGQLDYGGLEPITPPSYPSSEVIAPKFEGSGGHRKQCKFRFKGCALLGLEFQTGSMLSESSRSPNASSSWTTVNLATVEEFPGT